MQSHGPTDRYSPTPGTAQCPYCAQEVAGVSTPPTPACKLAMFSFTCPGCGRGWDELRSHQGVGRYYEPAAAAGAR
jgi:hypothetical protein